MVLLPWRRYFDFRGRSQRQEYWLFWLTYIAVTVVASVLDGGIFGFGGDVGIFGGLASMAILTPGFAVAVRRLHDTDRSGWWLLLILASIIGWIVLIVFFVANGTKGSNRFGPDPKNPERELAQIFS